jgi:transposase
LLGYLNRIRSSRRLEREAQRNIEVIWLVRGLKPDFKTIADFRRDNCGAFKSVFRRPRNASDECSGVFGFGQFKEQPRRG